MSLRESSRSAADSMSARASRMRAEDRRRYRSLGVARGRLGFAVVGLLDRSSGGSLSRGGPNNRCMVPRRDERDPMRRGGGLGAAATSRSAGARSGLSARCRSARLIELLLREWEAEGGEDEAWG
jgi:hypothetical protein